MGGHNHLTSAAVGFKLQAYDMKQALVVTLAILASLLVACEDDATGTDNETDTGADIATDVADADETLEPLDIPEGCNPLAADYDCFFPYPSNFFRVEGGPSGHQVVHSDFIMPEIMAGTIDPTRAFPNTDGFSQAPLIAALFEEAIDPESFTFWLDDTSATLSADSTTILLNAETGEAVEHYAELDMRRPDLPDRQVLIVRPLARLDWSTRYVVGIQGLVDEDGNDVVAPEGFRRLRDGLETGDEALDALGERYESDVFGALETFGVGREDLLLAWDFTTQSEEAATGDMLRMRADTIAYFEANDPVVEITTVQEGDEIIDSLQGMAFRRIQGTIEVPLFLTGTDTDAGIVRNDDGTPVWEVATPVPFTAWIPNSVASSDERARIVQWGHGFLGSQEEIDNGNVRGAFEELGYVAISVDWWGLSEPDRGPIIDYLLNAPEDGLHFSDRVHQGLMNQIALSYAIRTSLMEEEAFQIDGELVYDPAEHVFYGASLGHILGGVYMALAPHVERGVLNVGGGPFTYIMSRSQPFAPILGFLTIDLEDPLDVQKFVAVACSGFDRIDPTSYAPHVLTDTYDNAPESREVFLSFAIGDTSVPNLAGHFHARSLGIPHVQPAPRSINGVPTVDAPHTGSGFVEYDFGVELPDVFAAIPPPQATTSVHNDLRRVDAFELQIDRFFDDGVIENFCDGACDAEDAASTGP